MNKIIRYIKYLNYRRLYFKMLWKSYKIGIKDPESYTSQSMLWMNNHLHKVKSNYLNFGNAAGTENSTDVTE